VRVAADICAAVAGLQHVAACAARLRLPAGPCPPVRYARLVSARRQQADDSNRQRPRAVPLALLPVVGWPIVLPLLWGFIWKISPQFFCQFLG